MFRYKPDQGIYSRGTAFWLTTALLYFGCSTLWSFLNRWEAPANPIISAQIPILNLSVSTSLIVSTLVFAGGLWAIWKTLNSPKAGDLLIETEGEMRRVTWPSWDDTLNSSLIVLATVVIFLVFLAGADYVLTQLFQRILF